MLERAEASSLTATNGNTGSIRVLLGHSGPWGLNSPTARTLFVLAIVISLTLASWFVLPISGNGRPSAGQTGPLGASPTGPPQIVNHVVPTALPLSPLYRTVGPAASSTADFAWSTARAPPSGSLAGSGLAADSSLQVAVLFGGGNSSSNGNRTWIYSEQNDTWANGSTPSGLSARSDFAFAGDPATHVALLFGGLADPNTGRVDRDTWVYNFTHGNWSNVTRATGPAARQDPAFAIAPTLGVGLLFGGWNRNFSGTGALTFGDAWMLNLTTFNWSLLPAKGPTHPPPLEGASLSWDAARNQFELFGGCFPCASGVWGFAPSTGIWSLLSASGRVPSPRGSPVWAFDPAQQREVLFGGIGNGGPLNDTYEWDPGSGLWTPQAPASHPAGRYAAAATWMDAPNNETLLLTGGAGLSTPADLWRLAPVANVSILVRNGSNQLAIPNATVGLDGQNAAFTNSFGYRNLSYISPGEHQVNAIAPGFARTVQSLWVPPGIGLRVVVNLTPVPPATLSVRVIDLNGVPVIGAVVAVFLQGVLFVNPPLVTDNLGDVVYTGIPTFPVTVTAAATFYHSGTQVVNLTSGITTYALIVLTPYALAYVHVRGFLPPLTISVPLFDARVAAGPNVVGFTDFYGAVFLQMDVVGLVVLTASAPGFVASSLLVNAPYSGLMIVNFTLTSLPFGSLHVLVQDSVTHGPIPLAAVNLTSVPGSALDSLLLLAVSGPTGYSNASYPPSNYSVEVTHPGYYPNTSVTHLQIVSSGVKALTVNLKPLPGSSQPGRNGTYTPVPPRSQVTWPFLVVPVVLLLAGGTYLSLVRGESPPRQRPRRNRPRERPAVPLDPRTPPPPPRGG